MPTVLIATLLGTASVQQKGQNPLFSNHVNLRMGFSSATTSGRPTICIEGPMPNRFTIEACGTGYGFVHRDEGVDLAHFRGKFPVLTQSFSRSMLSTQIGLGFSEVQISEDRLGFQFNGSGMGVETAGPELSSSIQWIHQLGEKSEMIIDTNVGTAYFQYGSEMLIPQPQWFPFWEFSAGIGW